MEKDMGFQYSKRFIMNYLLLKFASHHLHHSLGLIRKFNSITLLLDMNHNFGFVTPQNSVVSLSLPQLYHNTIGWPWAWNMIRDHILITEISESESESFFCRQPSQFHDTFSNTKQKAKRNFNIRNKCVHQNTRLLCNSIFELFTLFIPHAISQILTWIALYIIQYIMSFKIFITLSITILYHCHLISLNPL